MKDENVVNVKPAPAIPIKLTPKVAETVERYDPERLEEHVLFRFQPTHTVKVPRESYSEEELKELWEWWEEVMEGVFDEKLDPSRTGPFVPDPMGTVIIWTFCGGDDADPDNGVYGDDCE